MKKQKIILIGPCGGGGVPKNGASAKNYHLAKYLQDSGANLKLIDTDGWRHNPMILLTLLFAILFNPNAKFIVATDNTSGYRTMKVFSMLPRKRQIIYWVIGGSIAEWLKCGKVKSKPYRVVEHFLVEGKKMRNRLSECGFENSIYVPNFKIIDYVPTRQQHTDNIVRFVFLSRIIPQKGCKIIIDAVKQLNKNNKDRFLVDFYGPVEESYREKFMHEVEALENVHYKGFLNLSDAQNYDILVQYDVMLFPTYWMGEGFPGIAIDAFIAGLPVVATDWSLNADIIKPGKLGVCIELPLKKGEKQRIYAEDEMPFDHDRVVENLVYAMQQLMENPQLIEQMSANCQKEASLYSINNVLSKDLFEQIGLDV